MSFNSPGFAPFFAIVLALNWLLVRRPTLRLAMLTAASAYFYGCREPWWLVPLCVQTAVDYWCARQIDAPDASERRRRVFLTISVVENLLLLGFFKYYDFFVRTAACVAGALGHETHWAPLALAVPAGISFYTFVTMSYTIDVYRRDVAAERKWLPFAFFVGFFPHLVAGPIIRATSFMPQIAKRPTLDREAMKESLFRIAFGLFKKIVVADYLAEFATQAFDHPTETSRVAAWVGVFAFSFQIYFDFCGYSDVAVGVARLLGYVLPENFERPYVAASFTEFWRRWHITLSTWLRDYAGVYFYERCPLTRRRHGAVRTVWALMLTMLACGLWHGAAWHFVLWGGLHGVLLAVESITRTGVVGRGMNPLSAVLVSRRVVVFLLVTSTWILFRATDGTHLTQLVHTLLAPGETAVFTRDLDAVITIVALALAAQYVGEFVDVRKTFVAMPAMAQGVIYTLVALAILVRGSAGQTPFIYFQF